MRAGRENRALPPDEALALERTLVHEVSQSTDTLQCVQAFLERRTPCWLDR